MLFLVFTKTSWTDIPRIRHQTALMLARQGHRVVFFEKNRFIGPCTSARTEDLELRRKGELLHHQLRPLRVLSELNALWEVRQIRSLQDNTWEDAIIVNFNYDYWFLRRLFPNNVIITVINDDFVAGAKWHMKKETQRVFALTAALSDHVLAVSHPLVRQIADHAPRASLFLPWARSRYQPPPSTGDRTDILFWGSLYENQNFPVIRFLLRAGVRIHFAGPIHPSKEIEKTLAMSGAVYHGVQSLTALEPVLARCCCSILPYDPRSLHGMFNAVTINNRAFELLSRGLPLLYCDLPALITAPKEVILPCRTDSDYLEAYRQARQAFYQSQQAIERFLSGHYEEDRYKQFMECVKAHYERRRLCTAAN